VAATEALLVARMHTAIAELALEVSEGNPPLFVSVERYQRSGGRPYVHIYFDDLLSENKSLCVLSVECGRAEDTTGAVWLRLYRATKGTADSVPEKLLAQYEVPASTDGTLGTYRSTAPTGDLLDMFRKHVLPAALDNHEATSDRVVALGLRQYVAGITDIFYIAEPGHLPCMGMRMNRVLAHLADRASYESARASHSTLGQ
jgi:hypothetical protein